MKQALIGFVLSVLIAGCTVAQPEPTFAPNTQLFTATTLATLVLPTSSPTPLLPTETPTSLPVATEPQAGATSTIPPTFTPTPTPIPNTPQPTRVPTRVPDIINDPTLPRPTGKIYFLWDPNPIPAERGVGELPKNNLYEAVFDGSSYNWYIKSKIEMFGQPLMILSPDSVKLAIVRYDDTNGNGIVEPYYIGSDYVGDDYVRDLTSIYVFNTIDSSLTHLTENEWNPGRISWLPDAQALTFAQKKDLYAVELDNPFHPSKLFGFSGSISNHKWSPNGRYLVSLHAPSDEPNTTNIIELFDSQNNKVSIISEITATPNELLWSQDSQWIAFSPEGRGLQIVNVTDEVIKELVPYDNKVFFEWAPNKSWLAYTNQSKLFLWDANTETSKQLSDISVSNKPAWSPDGSQIAVGYVTDKQSGILIVDRSNESYQELDIGMEASRITWSPNGDWLLFFSESDNGSGLYMVSKNNSIPFLFLDTTGRPLPYNIYWLSEK